LSLLNCGVIVAAVVVVFEPVVLLVAFATTLKEAMCPGYCLLLTQHLFVVDMFNLLSHVNASTYVICGTSPSLYIGLNVASTATDNTTGWKTTTVATMAPQLNNDERV
jgi:hypothetical protein